MCLFFFQAEDGIRELVRSRGLGDVYKRQPVDRDGDVPSGHSRVRLRAWDDADFARASELIYHCLLYTSDAADERSSVDLGGRRIIKKKQSTTFTLGWEYIYV